MTIQLFELIYCSHYIPGELNTEMDIVCLKRYIEDKKDKLSILRAKFWYTRRVTLLVSFLSLSNHAGAGATCGKEIQKYLHYSLHSLVPIVVNCSRDACTELACAGAICGKVFQRYLHNSLHALVLLVVKRYRDACTAVWMRRCHFR